jgi:hypothetical protein
VIYKLDGDTGAITLVADTTRTTELGTSEAAANFTVTPTSTTFAKGDRIVCCPHAANATSSMAAGFTFTFWYDGPTAAASGDSYITLTETITFLTTAPAGSTYYLRIPIQT